MIKSRAMLSEGNRLEAIILAISQLWSGNGGGISKKAFAWKGAVQLHGDQKYLVVPSWESATVFLEKALPAMEEAVPLIRDMSPQPPHTSGSEQTSNKPLKYFQGSWSLCTPRFLWSPKWGVKVLSVDDQSFKQLAVHLEETVNRQVINMLPKFYGRP